MDHSSMLRSSLRSLESMTSKVDLDLAHVYNSLDTMDQHVADIYRLVDQLNTAVKRREASLQQVTSHGNQDPSVAAVNLNEQRHELQTAESQAHDASPHSHRGSISCKGTSCERGKQLVEACHKIKSLEGHVSRLEHFINENFKVIAASGNVVAPKTISAPAALHGSNSSSVQNGTPSKVLIEIRSPKPSRTQESYMRFAKWAFENENKQLAARKNGQENKMNGLKKQINPNAATFVPSAKTVATRPSEMPTSSALPVQEHHDADLKKGDLLEEGLVSLNPSFQTREFNPDVVLPEEARSKTFYEDPVPQDKEGCLVDLSDEGDVDFPQLSPMLAKVEAGRDTYDDKKEKEIEHGWLMIDSMDVFKPNRAGGSVNISKSSRLGDDRVYIKAQPQTPALLDITNRPVFSSPSSIYASQSPRPSYSNDLLELSKPPSPKTTYIPFTDPQAFMSAFVNNHSVFDKSYKATEYDEETSHADSAMAEEHSTNVAANIAESVNPAVHQQAVPTVASGRVTGSHGRRRASTNAYQIPQRIDDTNHAEKLFQAIDAYIAAHPELAGLKFNTENEDAVSCSVLKPNAYGEDQEKNWDIKWVKKTIIIRDHATTDVDALTTATAATAITNMAVTDAATTDAATTDKITEAATDKITTEHAATDDNEGEEKKGEIVKEGYVIKPGTRPTKIIAEVDTVDW